MRTVPAAPWLLAVLVVWLGFQPLRADIIFLKDGFAIQGKVRREVTSEYDPVSREMLYIPKGFFSLDDGARWIYFSPTQVRVVEKMAKPVDERIVSRNMRYMALPRPMKPILEIVRVGPWDYQNWEREFIFRSPTAPEVGLKQAIARIDPFVVRVDSVTKFWWTAAYLTREFDAETIEKLLATHPEFQDSAKDKPAQVVARRMRLSDFYAQTSLFDLAERELDRLARDQPREKARIASARAMLGKLRARDEWEEIKKWHEGGRYTEVARRLARFPTNNVDDRILVDAREMQSQLKTAVEHVEQARLALDEQSRVVKTAIGRSLASAIGMIRLELHATNVDRLESFLGQVQEAARRKARGKPPQMTPEQLLSLAVSGWLLGSSSAEARPEAAVNLWKTRQMVLQYQSESDALGRQKILADYEASITPRVDLDEIAQLIDHLPPALPAQNVSTAITEVKTGKARHVSSYLLKLPPEYTHNRPYPVLLVLPDGKQTTREMIELWEKQAADHGYILACPQWRKGSIEEYTYSVEEHDAVFDTIHDLRRRFQVDSDRIFLFGLGEGGKMAFDVGLAHPDYFAGVLPMAAGPSKFPRRYWRNAQFLPFYVVNGTRAGDSSTLLRTQFDNWVLRGFPSLWMEYKGRGTEFFSGELPAMFDWMRHQKRQFPLRQLGTDGGGGPTGTEFSTMRAEDNRFYWLGMSNIARRHLAHSNNWNPQTQPAYATARIEPQTNNIYITGQGVGQFTIWLGRNTAGQYMIDFDKPVSVMVGVKLTVIRRKVTPSLAVLLEDLQRRGDRKHLFVGKLDVPVR